MLNNCWLRSPKGDQSGAATISKSGEVNSSGGWGGYVPFSKNGVRPLIVVYTDD